MELKYGQIFRFFRRFVGYSQPKCGGLMTRIKVPENPYRKELAGMYIENFLGKPRDEDIKKIVNGSNDDLSLDYYVGAERMINKTIQVFRTIDNKHLNGAGGAFSMMLFYISFEIERLSAFQNQE